MMTPLLIISVLAISLGIALLSGASEVVAELTRRPVPNGGAIVNLIAITLDDRPVDLRTVFDADEAGGWVATYEYTAMSDGLLQLAVSADPTGKQAGPKATPMPRAGVDHPRGGSRLSGGEHPILGQL